MKSRSKYWGDVADYIATYYDADRTVEPSDCSVALRDGLNDQLEVYKETGEVPHDEEEFTLEDAEAYLRLIKEEENEAFWNSPMNQEGDDEDHE